jgi:hypothetical protein
MEVNIENKQAGSQVSSSEINELVRAIRSAVSVEELSGILTDFQNNLPGNNFPAVIGNADANFEQLYINTKS